MAAKISIMTGGNSPWTADFDKSDITIGRGRDADVQLHCDDAVCASGIHARMQRVEGRWELAVEHRNGITIRARNGRSAFYAQGDRLTLDADTEITIGRSGPRLRFLAEPAQRATDPSREIGVRVISGFNSPWVGSFQQDCVTIGRSPTADVRLHPQRDTIVASEIHARLIRRDETWFL